MSEEEHNSNAPQQHFSIQRIYVKDTSFETPNSPSIFTSEWNPTVNVDLNTHGTKIADNVYEVTVRVTVTAKLGEKTAYLAEVHQAGIFAIAGFSEAEMGPMIHSFCPTVLFPYAREFISSLVGRGSFPRLDLAPVNFDALYAQHLAQREQAKTKKTTH